MGADWSSNIAQGIFRSASCTCMPDVYISDAFVRTSVTDDTLTYDVLDHEYGYHEPGRHPVGSLSSWNCDTFTYPSIPDTTVTAAPGTTTTKTIGPIKWGLGTTSYWWPNVPYQADYKARLHNLNLKLSRGGKVTHSKVVRFGFRQSERKRADAQSRLLLPERHPRELPGRQPARRRLRQHRQQRQERRLRHASGLSAAHSGKCPGWPQAVRNYQKLNYNFIRIHQELAAPYMIDTPTSSGSCSWAKRPFAVATTIRILAPDTTTWSATPRRWCFAIATTRRSFAGARQRAERCQHGFDSVRDRPVQRHDQAGRHPAHQRGLLSAADELWHCQARTSRLSNTTAAASANTRKR
jgi:hypothetical protein